MQQNNAQFPNEAKYQAIFDKKNSDPSVSLATLCKEHGTTYQSYRNWVKKRERIENGGEASTGAAKTTGAVPSHKARIVVHVSVRELVHMILNNVKVMPVSIDTIVRGLPPDQKRALAEALGLHRLEAVSNGDSGQA